MRTTALSLALALLTASPPTAAQVTGTYVPPRPRYAMLTVRYPAIADTSMKLATPAGSFTCTPPGVSVGLPMARCTLAVQRGTTVALTANYRIFGPVAQVGNGKAMTGKQWQGDCAGTIGTTCTLAMSVDRAVDISPYAQP